MSELICTTDTGFEVWPKDRTKGREIWMTRRDEDRFCDAVAEEFGPCQVIRAHTVSSTPEIPWRRRITDFGPNFFEWDNHDVAQTVDMMFPWPGWELTATEDYTNPRKPETFVGYRPAIYPPLKITFERTALLGVE